MGKKLTPKFHQERVTELRALVARLEGEIVGHKNDLQNVREMLGGVEAVNAALAAALGQLMGQIRHISNVSVLSGWTASDWEHQWAALRRMGEEATRAALKDTQTGTAGKGWPEVREQARVNIEWVMKRATPAGEGAWRIPRTSLERLGAALDTLEVK